MPLSAGSLNVPLIIGNGLATLGMSMLIPVLPAYARSLGASATLVGLLLASFGVTRLLVTLPSTWFAGRMGVERMLVGSPAIIAPAAVLCAVAGGFWPLALFCTVEGAAAAAYSTVGTAAIKADPKRRGRALSTYQTAGLVGAAIGPVFGGVLGQRFGLQAPFLIYGALAAIATWLTYRWSRMTGRVVLGTSAPAPSGHANGVWALLRAPGLRWLWPVAFTVVFARLGVQLVAAPLLGAWRLGLNARDIGVALSVGNLTALVAFYPAGWLADHVSRKGVIAGGMIGMVAALLLFVSGATLATFIAASMVLGASGALVGPTPLAYLEDTIPEGERIVGIALYRTVGDLGASIAPPLLGWLADRGGYRAPLIATIFLLLATLGIFALLTAVRPMLPARHDEGGVREHPGHIERTQ